MKYIVVRINGAETPVIFPALASHKRVAAAIEQLGGPVIAAGFLRIRGRHADDGTDDTLTVDAHGHSQSLRVGSRAEDSSLIQMCLNLPD